MNLGESMPTGTTNEETFEPEAIESPVLLDGTIQPLNLSTFTFLFRVSNPNKPSQYLLIQGAAANLLAWDWAGYLAD